MGAPATAYLNNGAASLPIHNVGVVKHDALLALKLAAYGVNIKTLFYLDGLLVVKDGANEGFAGCASPFSYNINHHNTSRWSKHRINASGEKVVFNDGGLNTMGDTSNVSVVFPPNDEFNATLTANFLSAFYDASTTHGYAVRHSRYDSLGALVDTNDNHVNSGSLAAGASANLSVPLSFGSLAWATEIHIYRSFITNPEGTYYSPQQIQVTRQLVNAQLNQNASGIYATSDRPLLASYIYQFDYYDDFDLASGSSTIPAGGMQGSYFQPIFLNTGYGPSPINILNHEVFAANNGNPHIF